MSTRPRLEDDRRVRAALSVLAGEPPAQAADDEGVDPQLVERWVAQFRTAGARAVVGHEPSDRSAHDRFLMLTSHELRTPLAILAGWIDTLVMLDDQLDPTTLDRALMAMRLNVRRLSRLADDLLDAAAVGLGRLELRVGTVDLGDVGRSVVDDLGSSRIDLTVADDATLRGDAARIRQILSNLVEDALRRTTERIDITVTSDPGGDVCVIEVLVPGRPPSPEEMLALFEPFDRGGTSIHAGLGLYVCRCLVVAHGGVCGVDGGEESMTLWVRLPHEGPPAPTRPTDADGSR